MLGGEGKKTVMKKEIRNEIFHYVAQYAGRHLTETTWMQPLVGFAAAGDPLFSRLKTAVSPTHAMPEDILPGARTAVAFFLPFAKTVAGSNREGLYASREWAMAYIETNQLIVDINSHMKTFIENHGYAAGTTPPTHNYDPGKLISDWSHRHIAYIAGLGRFGLNNMLITGKGCCGRFGSFVTTLGLEPDTPMTAETCLYRHDGSCGVCVARCVNEALFTDRFDRHKCYEMLLRNGDHLKPPGTADVCGKCLVGLPCSFSDPVSKGSR